jgi:hypothetical protein
LQRGDETDDPLGHALGRFHQGLVLVAVEVLRDVKPPAKLANLRLIHQPTEILAGVAGSDHLARAKHP